MKQISYKDLNAFLDVADSIENPFKYYESDGRLVHVELNMRTFLLAYDGMQDKTTIEKLKNHGFAEVVIKETKKIVFEPFGA